MKPKFIIYQSHKPRAASSCKGCYFFILKNHKQQATSCGELLAALRVDGQNFYFFISTSNKRRGELLGSLRLDNHLFRDYMGIRKEKYFYE